MGHLVSVSQLVSNNGNAFLNVTEDVYGAIGVWGSVYKQPTYLLLKNSNFKLINFEDEDCFQEWVEDGGLDYHSIVIKIEENGVLKYIKGEPQ